MHKNPEATAWKMHLRCEDDFINFMTYMPDTVRFNKPILYPCVVVAWFGEDSGIWQDYEFVYPQDIYPMLQ